MSDDKAFRIGAFVIGAVALAVVGVIATAKLNFFVQRPRAVAFFDVSVAGLSAGSPVTFRGVRIGQVTDVRLRIDSRTGDARIPVFMEFMPERIDWVDGQRTTELTQWRERGVRAVLITQSLVTGQQSVDLRFLPKTPETLVGVDVGAPEIPTAKTGLDAVEDELAKLPLKDLSNTALDILKQIKVLLAADGVAGLPEQAGTVMRESAGLVAALRGLVPELETSLKRLEADASRAIGAFEAAGRTADRETGASAAELRAALRRLDQTLKSVEQGADQVANMVQPRSAARQDLDAALRNLAAASGSFRAFADQLDRNPSSLVMGRQLR